MIAPAKLNLCLYLGPTRSDGLHELVSVFQPLDLGDRIEVSRATADEVRCPGIEGPNLAEAALARIREAGWDAPPVSIEIEKRIPVAAGLGGGSADAAAILNLAREDLGDRLPAIAEQLGADVPSQLDPRTTLVGGAGERLEPLPPPGEFGVLLIRDPGGLSTAEVYAEADRIGVARPASDLDRLANRIRKAFTPPPDAPAPSLLGHLDLLVNDLGEAAISLRPELSDRIAALEAAGAAKALVTGSGPTVFGLFPDRDAAAAALAQLPPELEELAIVTGPLELS